jgi:hypothetical protein
MKFPLSPAYGVYIDAQEHVLRMKGQLLTKTFMLQGYKESRLSLLRSL